jgi:hypothetical protein
MKRVTFIAAALLMAVLAVLAGRVAAQETNVSERTFLTFSSAVEMPGVTLQPGTYVFKLADTPSRNVVQVWDNDEKNMIGHWLFVQAERPRVTSDTVIMFKEQAAGTTPAVQYWYFPGERIGKEFIYPEDQAMRIAQRTGADVRTETGVVEGGGLASIQEQPAPSVSAQAEVQAEPSPSVAAEPLPEPAPHVQAEARVEQEPAPVAEPAAEPSPRAVGTTGADQAPAEELPRTASPLALSGLLGLLSLAGALTLRSIR